MKFGEALELMRQGKKVKRQAWGTTICAKNKISIGWELSGSIPFTNGTIHIHHLMADDWEEYKEPTVFLTFIEAIRRLRDKGGAIRRDAWRDDLFVDDELSFSNRKVFFDMADFLNNDWIHIQEKN